MRWTFIFVKVREDRNLACIKSWLLYLKTRRCGLQMLIRLSTRERLLVQHFIVFNFGLILSLIWCQLYICNIRAFIEFRTDILKSVNFSNFDNQRGAERFVIPNYVHYIRLNQSYIR